MEICINHFKGDDHLLPRSWSNSGVKVLSAETADMGQEPLSAIIAIISSSVLTVGRQPEGEEAADETPQSLKCYWTEKVKVVPPSISSRAPSWCFALICWMYPQI